MQAKLLFIAITTLLSTAALANNHGHNGQMEKCMNAALAKHPGKVVSLEAEIEKGRGAIYEFDIVGTDGKEWEVECEAKTGKVYEEELDVDPNSEEFKSKAKVTMEQAKKTALDKFPGDIESIEYELENGNPVYEFDIKQANGKEIEVEVDAVTGKIGETEEEVYEIGKD
ncbi:PepSY domain-containing protein [Methylophilus aquaticus]|uniref:PepSY domain-containing protein n=1 Tax=Methylophilus aquaticus TaxID=1971610 RepID=A0ABT9JQL3_9PROT|nr:PepSY domain-containing protein [Methylophilus aquaticus]MDP8566852.1 PepSY domain-containing protein [Methylophilus aquaticus]